MVFFAKSSQVAPSGNVTPRDAAAATSSNARLEALRRPRTAPGRPHTSDKEVALQAAAPPSSSSGGSSFDQGLQDVLKSLCDKAEVAGDLLLVADFRQQQSAFLQASGSLGEYTVRMRELLKERGVTALAQFVTEVEKEAAVEQLHRVVAGLQDANGERAPARQFTKMEPGARLWNVETGEEVDAGAHIPSAQKRDGSEVRYYAIRPNGTLSDMEKNGTLRSWNEERAHIVWKRRCKELEAQIAGSTAAVEAAEIRAKEAESKLYELAGKEEVMAAELEQAELELEEQQNAARKIQASFRGKKARIEVSHMREEQNAALRIQAAARGRLARKHLRDDAAAATAAADALEARAALVTIWNEYNIAEHARGLAGRCYRGIEQHSDYDLIRIYTEEKDRIVAIAGCLNVDSGAVVRDHLLVRLRELRTVDERLAPEVVQKLAVATEHQWQEMSDAQVDTYETSAQRRYGGALLLLEIMKQDTPEVGAARLEHLTPETQASVAARLSVEQLEAFVDKLNNGDSANLTAMLAQCTMFEAVKVLLDISARLRGAVFAALTDEQVKVLFGCLEDAMLADLLKALNGEQLARIVQCLVPDDRVRFFGLISDDMIVKLFKALELKDQVDLVLSLNDPELEKRILAALPQEMRGALMRALLVLRDPALQELLAKLNGMNANDAASELDKAGFDWLVKVICQLAPQRAADIIICLPIDVQARLMLALPDEVRAPIIDNLSADKVHAILDIMSASDLVALAETMPPASREACVSVLMPEHIENLAPKLPPSLLVLAMKRLTDTKRKLLLGSLTPQQLADMILATDQVETQVLIVESVPRALAAEAVGLLPIKLQALLLRSIGDSELRKLILAGWTEEMMRSLTRDEIAELLVDLNQSEVSMVLGLLSEEMRRAALEAADRLSVHRASDSEVHKLIMQFNRVEALWKSLGTQVDRRELVLGTLGTTVDLVADGFEKEVNRARAVELKAVTARDELISRAKFAFASLKKPPPESLVGQFATDNSALTMQAIERLQERVEMLEKIAEPIIKTKESKLLIAEAKEAVKPVKADAAAFKDELKKLKADKTLDKAAKKEKVDAAKKQQTSLKEEAKTILTVAKQKSGILKLEAKEAKEVIKAKATTDPSIAVKAYLTEKAYKKYVKKRSEDLIPPPTPLGEYKDGSVQLDANMKKAQTFVNASKKMSEKRVPLEQQDLMFQQMRGTALDKLTKEGITRWEKRWPEHTAEGDIVIPNVAQGLLWFVEGIQEPRGSMQALLSLYVKSRMLWEELGTPPKRIHELLERLGGDIAAAVDRMSTELTRLKKLELAAVSEREDFYKRAMKAFETLNRPQELRGNFVKDNAGVSGDELAVLKERVEFLEQQAEPKNVKVEAKAVAQEYKAKRATLAEALKALKGSVQDAMGKAYAKLGAYKKWAKKGNNKPPARTEEPKPTSVGLFRWAFGNRAPSYAPGAAKAKPGTPARR